MIWITRCRLQIFKCPCFGIQADKRIAKEDNRTIAATVALMVRNTLKIELLWCGDNCGCHEPCEEQLDRLEEQNRIFGGN